MGAATIARAHGKRGRGAASSGPSLVSDANAARTDEEHNATLATFYAIFGNATQTAYRIERLETNTALRVAVA